MDSHPRYNRLVTVGAAKNRLLRARLVEETAYFVRGSVVASNPLIGLPSLKRTVRPIGV
jgi:hypothetical protein